jgi:hypothetical protein
MTYEPSWDLDLALGEAHERNVWAALNLPACKVEVKADRLYPVTGNVFIEVAQLPRGCADYKPSGIHVSQTTYYAFCAGSAVSLVPTAVIRDIVAEQDRPPIDGGLDGDNPTKGYPISLRALLCLTNQYGLGEHP